MNDLLTSHYEELYHHGIKGQKWGVRRYQNKNGGLTPAGRKRYDGTSVSDSDVKAAKKEMKAAKKAYSKSFDKAYNRAFAAYSPIKKHREANDARWEDAANKAEAYNEAKKKYKTAKMDDKINRQREIVESWKDTSAIKDKKGRTIYSEQEVKEIRDGAIKRLEKLEYKKALSERIDQINAGESAAGRIWNMITGGDKIQAEIELDIEKRAKVNKAYRD